MRIPNRHRGRPITIYVDGKSVTAYSGEMLFAVLCAEGIIALRPAVKGSAETARGGLCGMGVCQECRVTVDGMPDRRACMTPVREGMEVVIDAG